MEGHRQRHNGIRFGFLVFKIHLGVFCVGEKSIALLFGDLCVFIVSKAQIEIGQKLKTTNLLVVKDGEPLPYWKNCVHIAPLNLGFTYYFISDDDRDELEKLLKGSADNVCVVTFNGKCGDCNFIDTIKGIGNIYQLDFYGGNEADNVKSKSLEDICKNDEDVSEE